MKSLYKLDMLVKYVKGGVEDTGVITGVLFKKEGVGYEIDGTYEIKETDVLTAFRPVAKRTKKVTVTRKTKVKAEAQLTQ